MRTILTLLLLASAAAADESWPQFRGPAGTGLSKATGLPRKFDEKTNVVWKTPIHHLGWSSPVVLGKQVWVTTAREDGKEQWAVCLDRDSGKVVHDVKVFDTPKLPYTFAKDYNSHASPSPVIEPGRVYVHFGSAGTACLDTETGKVLWQQRDLPCNHFRAPGSSPILWGDLLIVNFDGYDRQYAAAMKKATGEVVWKTDRSLDYKTTNGDLKKAYSTCTVIEVGGKPQVISSAAAGTVALDPRTGKEIWKVHHGGMNEATPPIYAHGLVYVTAGHIGKLVAIDPTGSGDVTKTHIRWTADSAPSRPAPIVLGELLFLVNDKGNIYCLEAKTGKELWQRRAPGNYYSSPIVADGHLYVFDRTGKCTVVTADSEGKVVATNKLGEEVNATPAVAGKALFVRTVKHLYRIEAK